LKASGFNHGTYQVKNRFQAIAFDDCNVYRYVKVPPADGRDERSDAEGVGSGYRSVDEAVTMPNGRPVKFSAPTLNFAIKELGERGNFERAHALYLWMGMQKTPKYDPNRYTLVSLFGAASERAHARVIIKVWRQALLFTPDMVNSEVGSAAITALGRCENWPAAFQVWKDMGDMGEPRNLYAYTAALTVLRESQRWEEAADVFRAMRDEQGVRPDALCAGLMLAAFDGARRWREANAMAKRLVDVYNVQLDEHLAHTVITLAGRAGDMPHARAAFDRMRNSTLVVTTYSYNCLLGGYARNGDWEGAASVLDDLKRAHLRPDSYTFTHLVSAAERSGFYKEADAVWELMLASRIPPHTVMCGAYVHCLGCQGRWMEAEALIGQMRDRWNVRRNGAVYNALLGALVRADKLERALVVLDEMQTVDGILPTEITFMLLVRACSENGMVKRAKELAAVRDALSETGALENDFSKYSASPASVSSSSSYAGGGGCSGYEGGGSGYAGGGLGYVPPVDAGGGDIGRAAAGLPPDERRGRR
jgi:pentatricopeptide repeat protein